MVFLPKIRCFLMKLLILAEIFNMKYAKYLICLFVAAFTLICVSFNFKKCDHVFTQIEQANIKVERPEMYRSITLPGTSRMWPDYSCPTGLQEGKELICVKCFFEQKQILDYGQPEKGHTLSESIINNTYPLTFDTIFLRPSNDGHKRIDSTIRCTRISY